MKDIHKSRGYKFYSEYPGLQEHYIKNDPGHQAVHFNNVARTAILLAHRTDRFNLFWVAVAYTYLVAFIIPLPGDRGYFLNNYFPIKEEVVVQTKEPKNPKPRTPVDPLVEIDERELYVGSIREIYKVHFPKVLVDYVYKESNRRGVDYHLVMGLIAAESSFLPNQVSRVGAVGYTQVWPKWHKERIGGRNINDPYVNIQVGIDYLVECLDRRGDLYRALECYNGSDSKPSADRYYQRVTGRLHALKINNLKLAGI